MAHLSSVQREVFDPSQPLGLGCCLRQQLQVFHHWANCDGELVSVNNTAKLQTLVERLPTL